MIKNKVVSFVPLSVAVCQSTIDGKDITYYKLTYAEVNPDGATIGAKFVKCTESFAEIMLDAIGVLFEGKQIAFDVNQRACAVYEIK